MITFKTLGTVQLTNASGTELHTVLSQPKRLVLLTYLALRPPSGFVRRDTLLALFWPDSTEERARSALSQSLSFLRRALGDGVVITRGTDEVGLAPGSIRIDAVELDGCARAGDLEQALALYSGDFLDGIHLSELPELERWVDDERRRLRRAAIDAAVRLTQQAAASGERRSAIVFAERAFRLDDEDESALIRLLEAYGRAGDAAGAQREYDLAASRFRADGRTESRQLRECVQRICSAEQATVARPSGVHVEIPRAAAVTAAPMAVPAPPTAKPPAVPPRTAGSVALATAALLLVSLVGFVHWRQSATELLDTRIVVAAFQNQTGDERLDPLGFMAADWTTDGLSRSGIVEVVDPATALLASSQLRDSTSAGLAAVEVSAIASRTRSGLVVTGAYYREGDSLVFRTRLTAAGTGKVLATPAPVKSSATEPHAALQEIRSRIVGALAMHLDPRLATVIPPGSTTPPREEAYRAYVQGLTAFTRKSRAEDPRQYLLRAHELDSTFVQPLIWLAWSFDPGARRDSVVALLEPHRERLTALDTYALDYLSAMRDRRLEDALEAARRASEIAPGSHWAHNRGLVAMHLNRPSEAVASYRTVISDRGLMREWPEWWISYGDALRAAQLFEEALAVAGEARRAHPGDLTFLGHEAFALAWMGDRRGVDRLMREASTYPDKGPLGMAWLFSTLRLVFEKAGDGAAARHYAAKAIAEADAAPPLDLFHREELIRDLITVRELPRARREINVALAMERATQATPSPQLRLMSGTVAVLAGDSAGGRSMIDTLARDQSRERWLSLRCAARIAALLGERDRAVSLLVQSYEAGGTKVGPVRNLDWELMRLRSYPPFERLIRPQG